jgi:hypothetical protein
MEEIVHAVDTSPPEDLITPPYFGLFLDVVDGGPGCAVSHPEVGNAARKVRIPGGKFLHSTANRHNGPFGCVYWSLPPDRVMGLFTHIDSGGALPGVQ